MTCYPKILKSCKENITNMDGHCMQDGHKKTTRLYENIHANSRLSGLADGRIASNNGLSCRLRAADNHDR